MAARNGRRRTRSGRVLDAALWGGAAGAAGGAALGAAIDSVGAALGAAIRAVVYAPAEVLTTLRRVAGAVTLVYRLVAAAVYRDRPLVAIMAEEVPASELRYVVPFEARSRYRRRRAVGPGRDPVQHPGGPARDGEHDRHHRPRRRRRDRHPRLDPHVRGQRQADLRRHLHQLPP